MANNSIYAAFERMWLHTTNALENKSNTDHNHDGIYATETYVDEAVASAGSGNALQKTGDTMEGVLKFTENVHYGETLPENGEEGQIFFLEDTGNLLPIGGSVGQVLTKLSSTDGDVAWADVQGLPEGGSAGQVLVKDSNIDGDASWGTDLAGNAATATKLKAAVSIALTGDVTGSIDFDGSEDISITAAVVNNSHTHTWSNISDNATCTINTSGTITGSQVFGAVYNDYAEYRELRENIEIPYGRVVIENGDDTLSLSTKRLQGGGNICSDTFGFAIGETIKAKMPIAVSGRALVYTYEDRNTYEPGDAVCTGPEGTVSKMAREEIKEYPDRIIGYVSAVPAYETWGENNVAVNGRIWIKVI